MLQQTQVDRVRDKYVAFLQAFPDFAALGNAALADVLALWQGLGYNRRAVALHNCAKAVVQRHGGTLPVSVEEMEALPGIGPYTARAVAAFAFGIATPFIETNIRSVYIHHYFQDRAGVKDSEIMPLVAQTLDAANPREWYYALMDYGAMLKRTHGNPNRKSVHHVRQAPFRGSNRERRSMILKAVLAQPGVSEAELEELLRGKTERLHENLQALEQEGFIRRELGRYFIQ
ncbi:A/G-specific adenine glycosylase [Geomonas sp. Red875]|uniref:Adenine DNA glycosylase n=2 Tax=Geomesophilobacter sediminis TaxID=2798584 RepID=A0A8J7J194_9BACT|nr:A/G-specific adenine glycosylase [Geomesophilobacter sediminis]